MKRFVSLALLAIVALGLFVTNPTLDDFRTFIRERSDERLREETGDSAFGRLLSSLGSDLAAGVAARAAERKNYGVISLYTIDLDGDEDDDGDDDFWRFLGIGGQFIPLNEPGDNP